MSRKKLEGFIEKKSIRAETIDDYDSIDVLGVSNKEGITETDHKKSKNLSKYQLIEEGDFAYNPYRINVGSIGLVPSGVSGLVSPAYVVFKTNNRLIPELLLDFLKSSDGLFQINKYARGTVRKALRFEDLCQIQMKIPSLQLQNQILQKKLTVESETCALKSELSRQQALLSRLRQQILQEAIEGKLTCDWRASNPGREPASALLKRIADEKAKLIKAKKIKQQKPLPPINEIEKPFDLPDGWEWCRLSDLFLFIDYRGKTPKKIKSGVRLITARNVRLGKLSLDPEDFISEKEYEERMTRGYPKYGDLLFTTEAPLGNVCLLTAKDEKISTGQRLITFQSYSEELPNILFMFFMLSPFFQDYLLKNATGVTAKGIKASKLRDILIPIPPADEQQTIITKIEKLLATCDQLEMQTNSSQTHTDALMQAVLREAFSQSSDEEKTIDARETNNIVPLKLVGIRRVGSMSC